MKTADEIISPFEIKAKDEKTMARTGVLYTRHGKIETPVFMPVATQASVKNVNDEDLRNIGVECILSNTYHLYLRPGTDVLEKVGGLHKFMNWDRSILTDSGGFQVFSLSNIRKIKEDGVMFQSHHDGSRHFFTPENVIDSQSKIDSDIWVCLDICVRNPASKKEAAQSLQTTKKWAERAVNHYHTKVPEQKITQNSDGSYKVEHPMLFGIIQGSVFEDLRKDATLHMINLPVHGYCIGGLCVGEGQEEMNKAVEVVTQNLPENRPRYFMGLGSPEDLLNCIERGVDMFDCVWPTRTARNGRIMTKDGHIYIEKAMYKFDASPLEEGCGCYTCQHYSKAYLSHLSRSNEYLSHRLLSIHNIYFLVNLMRETREAIKQNRFTEFKTETLARFNKNKKTK